MSAGTGRLLCVTMSFFVFYFMLHLLWPRYEIGQAIIFLPCVFFLSFFFFSSPNLSGLRLDVYHSSTHGVALLQI